MRAGRVARPRFSARYRAWHLPAVSGTLAIRSDASRNGGGTAG